MDLFLHKIEDGRSLLDLVLHKECLEYIQVNFANKMTDQEFMVWLKQKADRAKETGKGYEPTMEELEHMHQWMRNEMGFSTPNMGIGYHSTMLVLVTAFWEDIKRLRTYGDNK